MKKLRITIGDKSYDVTVEVLEDDQATPRPMVGSPGQAAAPAPQPVASPASSAPATSAPAGPGAVVSPMSGTVKSIEVKQGDSVTAGQPVVILDAMKMENRVAASSAGKVTEIHVSVGDSVEEGQPLMVIA